MVIKINGLFSILVLLISGIRLDTFYSKISQKDFPVRALLGVCLNLKMRLDFYFNQLKLQVVELLIYLKKIWIDS